MLCYVMTSNVITCHVMLYNMCHVMLYNICHVIIYNTWYVMLYNICYITQNIGYVMTSMVI